MMASCHAAGTANERGTPEPTRKATLRPWLVVLAAPIVLAAFGCAPKPRITGTVNTTDFVIAAGQVVTAVGEVTIIASHRIDIYGVLEVAHGATVTFKSPTVNIPGTVQYQDRYVSWWLRSKFQLNRAAEAVRARFDQILGRTPNYWARGGLDCFTPGGRAAALSAAPGGQAAALPAAPGGQARREPGWRWKKKPNESVQNGQLSERKN